MHHRIGGMCITDPMGIVPPSLGPQVPPRQEEAWARFVFVLDDKSVFELFGGLPVRTVLVPRDAEDSNRAPTGAIIHQKLLRQMALLPNQGALEAVPYRFLREPCIGAGPAFRKAIGKDFYSHRSPGCIKLFQ